MFQPDRETHDVTAAVKKELRDSFERDSASVDLSEEIYPDINVITGEFLTFDSCDGCPRPLTLAGILKDYLRELPSPLITKTLYEVVLKATAAWPLKMTMGMPDASPSAPNAVALLDCLPEAEKERHLRILRRFVAWAVDEVFSLLTELAGYRML
eukprot:g36078.t1